MLEARGFHAARWTFEMERPTLDHIRVPGTPAGIELRRADGDPASLRRLWDASGEAFEDHWGGIDRSDAGFDVWRSEPYTDPGPFVVAWDGDQLAGGVMPIVNAAENRELGVNRGWMMSVFVRRSWRRRGLGASLVGAALTRLRERGLSSAVLTVDADNPTGPSGCMSAPDSPSAGVRSATGARWRSVERRGPTCAYTSRIYRTVRGHSLPSLQPPDAERPLRWPFVARTATIGHSLAVTNTGGKSRGHRYSAGSALTRSRTSW